MYNHTFLEVSAVSVCTCACASLMDFSVALSVELGGELVLASLFYVQGGFSPLQVLSSLNVFFIVYVFKFSLKQTAAALSHSQAFRWHPIGWSPHIIVSS